MENDVKRLLQKNNFSFKKAFGQNFITDEDLLNNVVEKSGAGKNDVVLEIGCGAGTLTKVLAKNCKKVIGYEIDKTLIPVLKENLSEFSNVEIINKDVMKEGVAAIEEKIGEEYILIANLPYYVTTPIVTEFIENAKMIKAIVIMVQEEVAERFSARPSSSEYGAITVAINLRGSAKIIERVKRDKFYPVPNVDSAVVKIDIDRKKFEGVDLNEVRKLVRVGFSGRRKMLINNIMRGYSLIRQDAEKLFEKAGIDKTARAENLSEYDFVRLSEEIGKNI